MVFLSAGVQAWALTPQGPGEHSTIDTTSGPIRDDELAKMVGDAITASGNTPSSVKVFFNSCFGGGMLDDFPGALNGVPFIGASASDSDQPAWAPDDEYAGSTGSGAGWSNALAGAVTAANPGDNVAGTAATAGANDPYAPGGQWAGSIPPGDEPENPQTTTANGGAGVGWSPGAEAVVFGGNANGQKEGDVSCGNDVSNMEGAFLDMWGSDPNSNIQSTGGNPGGGGSKQDLQNMITNAANNIQPGEELVLYVSDHGDTEFDFDEWLNWFWSMPPVVRPGGFLCAGPGGELPVLHEGWEQGLSGNVAQGDTVAPGINLLAAIGGPFDIDSFFDVYWDGVPLDLPDELLPGEEAFIPIPYDPVLFAEGPHMLQFVGDPLNPAPFPLELLNLELTSGEIRKLTAIGPLDGDYNGDGVVNAADYTVWRDVWESGGIELWNDSTPGMVDESDYWYWKEHFGEVVPLPPLGAGSGLAAAVPEPSTLCLAVLALLALAGHRRGYASSPSAMT
jgi:hypothetical protein